MSEKSPAQKAAEALEKGGVSTLRDLHRLMHR